MYFYLLVIALMTEDGVQAAKIETGYVTMEDCLWAADELRSDVETKVSCRKKTEHEVISDRMSLHHKEGAAE